MSGPTVLGLCSFTHDSAAALVVDGSLRGMVEEERLSGVKHTKAYPAHAIAWLLDQAGLRSTDVDIVAYNFDGPRYLGAAAASARLLLDSNTRASAIPRARGFSTVYRNYRSRMHQLRDTFPNAKIRAVRHHRAHGLYAFASSGCDDAAVLVVDSLGEYQTTTMARAVVDASGVHYEDLCVIRDPASLGYAYGAVTQHLGWRRGDEEGTVMALAAYGDPSRFRELMRRGIPLTRTGFRLDPQTFPPRTLMVGAARVTSWFVDQTCPPRAKSDLIEPVHADLAAALQERTEEVMVHLAQRAGQITDASVLCLAGGVAMNCLSIGKILAADIFRSVSVPPAPGDAGTAIGAAVAAHLDTTGRLANGIVGACYLGPTPGTLSATLGSDLLEGLSWQEVADPSAFLADRLAEGQIVGLIRGPVEAGPRALGNRSILASPLRPDVVARLNNAVKFREPFRPFAPVVLASRARDYFDIDQASPFMSIAVPVTPRARDELPTIVHANGTARVQTVEEQQNPFLFRLLTRFAEITSVPVLINTSLNIKGKPMCGTLPAAIECLRESGLDALMLEDGTYVTKAES
jgi:carbamoyltransferase